MEIIRKILHKVDHFNNEVTERPEDKIPNVYIREIIDIVETKKGIRRHIFKSETVESKTLLDFYLEGEFDEYKERFPAKLMAEEKIKHAQIAKMGKAVRVGILFQIVYEVGEKKKIILFKSDNIAFFDDNDFELKTGLPKDKKVFKAFLIEYNEDGYEVFIHTDNKATYWWDSFLDLKELQSDEINTHEAYKAIERRLGIFKKERKYEQEYRLLKNILLLYFRTETKFSLEEISTKIENYAPQNDSLKEEITPRLLKIANAIRKFPKEGRFDPVFNIIPKSIPRRRLIEQIELRPNLSLNIEGGVESLENVVKPMKIDGIKSLVINTTTGYNKFGGQ